MGNMLIFRGKFNKARKEAKKWPNLLVLHRIQIIVFSSENERKEWRRERMCQHRYYDSWSLVLIFLRFLVKHFNFNITSKIFFFNSMYLSFVNILSSIEFSSSLNVISLQLRTWDPGLFIL